MVSILRKTFFFFFRLFIHRSILLVLNPEVETRFHSTFFMVLSPDGVTFTCFRKIETKVYYYTLLVLLRVFLNKKF